MQKAIGTSLLVIALNTFAGFLGHAANVTVDYSLVALVSSAAVFGSFIGSRIGARVPANTLRRGFGAFVLVMACFVLYQQF